MSIYLYPTPPLSPSLAPESLICQRLGVSNSQYDAPDSSDQLAIHLPLSGKNACALYDMFSILPLEMLSNPR